MMCVGAVGVEAYMTVDGERMREPGTPRNTRQETAFLRSVLFYGGLRLGRMRVEYGTTRCVCLGVCACTRRASEAS
eukprot:1692216-Rhodomonas_salina.1